MPALHCIIFSLILLKKCLIRKIFGVLVDRLRIVPCSLMGQFSIQARMHVIAVKNSQWQNTGSIINFFLLKWCNNIHLEATKMSTVRCETHETATNMLVATAEWQNMSNLLNCGSRKNLFQCTFVLGHEWLLLYVSFHFFFYSHVLNRDIISTIIPKLVIFLIIWIKSYNFFLE